MRQYTVTDDGDALDAHGNDIGDVVQGERFNVDPDPPSKPYPYHYYGTVAGRGLTLIKPSSTPRAPCAHEHGGSPHPSRPEALIPGHAGQELPARPVPECQERLAELLVNAPP